MGQVEALAERAFSHRPWSFSLPPPVAQFLALIPPAHGAIEVRHGLAVFHGDALGIALALPLFGVDGLGEFCFFLAGHSVVLKKPAFAGCWVR